MSSISTYLGYIQTKKWASEVRTAIVNAISQCYSDVSNPTLQTAALETAIQNKINAGQMAALTIGDGTITRAKLDPNMTLGMVATVDEETETLILAQS